MLVLPSSSALFLWSWGPSWPYPVVCPAAPWSLVSGVLESVPARGQPATMAFSLWCFQKLFLSDCHKQKSPRADTACRVYILFTTSATGFLSYEVMLMFLCIEMSSQETKSAIKHQHCSRPTAGTLKKCWTPTLHRACQPVLVQCSAY